MVKIKYVGAKDNGERAFKELTNIEWFEGDVHPIAPAIASKMLAHPDVFALDASEEIKLDSIEGAKKDDLNETIPAWVATGIDAGLDDAQLEAIAQAGGPETVAGMALWLDMTGKAYNVAPPPPAAVIRMPDGMPRILDGMSREDLMALAKGLDTYVHHNAGEVKIKATLLEAFPLKA